MLGVNIKTPEIARHSFAVIDRHTSGEQEPETGIPLADLRLNFRGTTLLKACEMCRTQPSTSFMNPESGRTGRQFVSTKAGWIDAHTEKAKSVFMGAWKGIGREIANGVGRRGRARRR